MDQRELNLNGGYTSVNTGIIIVLKTRKVAGTGYFDWDITMKRKHINGSFMDISRKIYSTVPTMERFEFATLSVLPRSRYLVMI